MYTSADEVIDLPDYEKMYKTLFNAMTDAIELLQNAQQTTEEQYIESEHTVIKKLPLSEPALPPEQNGTKEKR